jgi:preprotein translocase subunit SecG
MSTLLNLLMIVQILSALGMIGLILIQHGKGADMGAAFGSGTSGSLFGASGGANFLSRTTAVLAAVFFVCTLAQAYFGNLRAAPVSEGSVLERSQPANPPTAADLVPGANPVVAPASPASVPAPAASSSPASQIPGK